MGWFSYKCPECGNFKKSLVKREKVADCPQCGQKSEPILRPGSVQIVERLDNGAMARRVERLHNIEDIMEERDKKSSERAMEEIEALDEED